jgi:Sulfotransferase domain
MVRRTPDFLIIGAAKCATTWLQRNLQQLPAIFMPNPELHYFSREFHRGAGWYASQFTGATDDQVMGEKSNSYLEDPVSPDRIRHALPQVRLVVQLRNPIERAHSDYCMLYRRGEVSADIARYLAPGRTPLPRFLDGGMYYRHLSRYLDHFERERVAVVLYDDITAGPLDVVTTVCAHLGVEAPRDVPIGDQRVKNKAVAIIPPHLRKRLAPLKGAVGPVRHTRWFRLAWSMVARPLRYPQLTPELRMRLRDHYADDVRNLASLLGRDLDPWLAEPVDTRRGEGPAAAGATHRSGAPTFASR